MQLSLRNSWSYWCHVFLISFLTSFHCHCDEPYDVCVTDAQFQSLNWKKTKALICKDWRTYYLLIPWSIALLEKLTGSQLVKKCPAFYGTRRFITKFTNNHHLSLSWVRSIQSIPPHPTSRRSISILSSHLRRGLTSGLFLSPKPCIELCCPHTCYMPHPTYSSRFYPPKNIGWGIQTIKLLNIQFSTLAFYVFPLRPKYSPQHSILKHPQPTFLPQCNRPSFTPIHNNRQNYSSVYLCLCTFS